MTELVAFGETGLRLSAAAGERLETADRLRVRAVGPESNPAVAARRVGIDAAWLSRLPDSPLGHRVAGELRGYDLDVVVEWVDDGDERLGLTFEESARPPRGNARVHDQTDAAMAGVSMDDVPVARVEAADVAYTTGATPALSSRAATATARFLKAASDGGATTAFGLTYQPDRWDGPEAARETLTEFFPAVDVLVTSDEDAARVLDESGQPPTVAHALGAEYGFETVVVRREESAVAWRDSTVHELSAVETDGRDATGAEDAFAGGFLAALADDEALDRALAVGLAADALSRTVRGAVPTVTRAEIDRVAEEIGD
jgi:2-dehydro-3-deoxygluconokinase